MLLALLCVFSMGKCMRAMLFTNPLEESQWYSCLICLLSCLPCQPESLVLVSGSRVTHPGMCLWAFLLLRECSRLQIGMGCWRQLKSDRQQRAWLWNKQAVKREAEGLPVKRLEWRLARAPRCIVALAAPPWQRKLCAFLPVPSLGDQTVRRSHLNSVWFLTLTPTRSSSVTRIAQSHFHEFSCVKQTFAMSTLICRSFPFVQ